MITLREATIVVALLAAANPISSIAQTPDPSAASSPHQRQATGTGAPESPADNGIDAYAASSPHQREAMESASPDDAKMKGSESPASFVNKAAQDGMTEVELGKLALSKSDNPDVKQFAQQMVQDHGKANTELAGIAKEQNLEIPRQLDSQHQAIVRKLGSKSGTAFDSAYAENMVTDHSKAITLFQSEAKSSDPELADFAKTTLPTLQEHKRMADALHASTGDATARAK